MSCNRRDLLSGAAGLALFPMLGCGGNAAGAGADGGGSSCTQPSSHSGGAYCLVEPLIVRVPGAVQLAVGQAVLLNADDNTAVIVARDAGGLHALSGICTHACCIVSLCRDASCSSLTTTPGICTPTDVAAGAAQAESILCPCHGSSFRLDDGAVLSGPASLPLPALALRIDGNDVLVDTGMQVAASDRI